MTRRIRHLAMTAMALLAVLLPPEVARARSGALVFVRPQPSGPAGSQVLVVGLGFDAAKPVEVRWGSVDGEGLGRASGPDFSVDVVIPDVAPGLYTLVVASRQDDGALGSAGSTEFLVTPPGSPQPVDELNMVTKVPAPGSAEASTPTPVYLWALIVIGLVTLAVVAVRNRPRRQRVPAAPEDGSEPN